MAIVMQMEWPGVTRADYDSVMDALGLDASPPEGALFHVAGGDGAAWHVIDVWESEEACNRFGEVLVPILQEVGIDDQPQRYPTHAFVSS